MTILRLENSVNIQFLSSVVSAQCVSLAAEVYLGLPLSCS